MHKNINNIENKLLKLITKTSELNQICTYGISVYNEEVALGVNSGLEEKVNKNYIKFYRHFNDTFNELITSLIDLNFLICKHKLNDKELSLSVYSKLDNYEIYFSVHSQVIESSLLRQYDNIFNDSILNKITSSNLGNIIFFKNTLCDVCSFYNKMCNFLSIDSTKFPKVKTNNSVTAISSFDACTNLSNHLTYFENGTTIPVSIFLLRQAIKLRLLEIFEIDSVIDNNKNTLKIKMDMYLDVESIDSNCKFPKFLDSKLLKLIIKWTKKYMHSEFIENYYLIEYTQYIIKDFIRCSTIVQREYIKSIYIENLVILLNNKNPKLQLTSKNIIRK